MFGWKRIQGSAIRLAILLIDGYYLIEYAKQFASGIWSQSDTAICVLLLALILLQLVNVHGHSVSRVAGKMAGDIVLVTTLALFDASLVVLFLPIVFAMGRTLPPKVAVPAVILTSAAFVTGKYLLHGFAITSWYDVIPGWALLFIPGWMGRLRAEDYRRTKALLAQISTQQQELQLAHAELIRYAWEAEETAALRERTHIAGEIHDTVGHVLTSVIRGLDACRELIRSKPAEAEPHLTAMRELASDGLDELRRSVRSMQQVERWYAVRDWRELLQRFAENVTNTTGVAVGIIHSAEVEPSKRYAVYQSMKEAVTNAIRHGKAAGITIMQREKDGFCRLEITNNGLLPEGAPVPGEGMAGMKRRMQSVGGDADFAVVDDAFRVSLIWPVDAQENANGEGAGT